ncbi:MAG: dienelactone hydrolase family protein [Acidimicrobiales bacterium]
MQARTETIMLPAARWGSTSFDPMATARSLVVFFHHGPGLDEGSKQTMARIAEWGYYVVTRSLPPRRAVVHDEELGRRRDEEMFGLVLGTGEDQVAEDLGALLAWLPSDPAARSGAMGVVGYCIGARSVLCTIRDHGEQFRRHGAAPLVLHHRCGGLAAPGGAVLHRLAVHRLRFGRPDAAGLGQRPAHRGHQPLDKGEAEIHDGADHGSACSGGRTTRPPPTAPTNGPRSCSIASCRADQRAGGFGHHAAGYRNG